MSEPKARSRKRKTADAEEEAPATSNEPVKKRRAVRAAKEPEEVAADESTPAPESDCTICYENYKDDYGELSCKHRYCFKCIESWSKTETTCPLCKATFNFIDRYNSAEKSRGKIKKKRVKVKRITQRETLIRQYHEQHRAHGGNGIFGAHGAFPFMFPGTAGMGFVRIFHNVPMLPFLHDHDDDDDEDDEDYVPHHHHHHHHDEEDEDDGEEEDEDVFDFFRGIFRDDHHPEAFFRHTFHRHLHPAGLGGRRASSPINLADEDSPPTVHHRVSFSIHHRPASSRGRRPQSPVLIDLTGDSDGEEAPAQAQTQAAPTAGSSSSSSSSSSSARAPATLPPSAPSPYDAWDVDQAYIDNLMRGLPTAFAMDPMNPTAVPHEAIAHFAAQQRAAGAVFNDEDVEWEPVTTETLSGNVILTDLIRRPRSSPGAGRTNERNDLPFDEDA